MENIEFQPFDLGNGSKKKDSVSCHLKLKIIKALLHYRTKYYSIVVIMMKSFLLFNIQILCSFIKFP